MLGSLRTLLPPQAIRPLTLRPGEHVFRQGDPARAIYVVDHGHVSLRRHTPGGDEVTVHVARAGESFAEAALFAPHYHCDAIAGPEPVSLTSLDKQAVLSILTGNPQAGLELAAHLARQVQQLRSQLELRNIRSARDRVQAWLRLNAKGEPAIVAVDRTLNSISTELGLTPEAFYRTLSSLAREGFIVRSRETIRITSRQT